MRSLFPGFAGRVQKRIVLESETQAFIDIIALRLQHLVITVVEMISPWDKYAGPVADRTIAV